MGIFFPTNFGISGSSLCPLSTKHNSDIDFGLPENITASIDGTKTKELGGGCGDGIINGRTIEIKTARAGTGNTMSFQHELGERPWAAEFMCFIDIAPHKFYLSIFPNFSEEKTSLRNLFKKISPSLCD